MLENVVLQLIVIIMHFPIHVCYSCCGLNIRLQCSHDRVRVSKHYKVLWKKELNSGNVVYGALLSIQLGRPRQTKVFLNLFSSMQNVCILHYSLLFSYQGTDQTAICLALARRLHHAPSRTLG